MQILKDLPLFMGRFSGSMYGLFPNLLSFKYPVENIALALLWLFLLLAMFSLAFKGIKLSLALLALCVPLGLLGHEKAKAYDVVTITPVQMFSGLSSDYLDSDHVRVFKLGMPFSGDMLYGPYVYIPFGRYCMKMNMDVDASFQQLKWYISDAFIYKVYQMEEIFNSELHGDFNPSLCFFNDAPHYPKEVKLYGKGFVGEIRLKDIVFLRTAL
ncbi:hypothetical protein [Methylomarinovum caldicuralii]|nr:hypothetical protein [Methylomarinovum caldicuralii]